MPISFLTKLITFHDKVKSIQYNACLATTGAIRRVST